jgi:two-component sensor histidine kinase
MDSDPSVSPLQEAAQLELRRALAAERAARVTAERLVAEKDALIARNDVLMREVDHRVKNSLQLVASMLGLQARKLTDQSASQALLEAQDRISAIAAVHDQL